MPPQKKTATNTREKRKTPTKSKTAPTSLRRKSRRGGSANAGKSKLSSPSPVTTPSSSRATTPTPLLLPPSLTGRPLPTLILDTGGWTIKHGTVTPTINANSIASNHAATNASANAPIATNNVMQPKKSYNVIAKPKHVLTTLVSNEINTIQNKSNLIFKRPLERGYTTDLGVQLQIWEYILNMEQLEYRHSFSNTTAVGGGSSGTAAASATVDGGSSNISKSGPKNSRMSPIMSGSCIYTHTASVFCLHQPFTPRNILEREDEIWFRDFGFGRIHRMLGVCCSAFRFLKLAKEMKKKIWMELNDNNNTNEKTGEDCAGDDIRKKKQEKFQEEYGFVVKDDETECCCVIDSGFSLTHIVPTVKARAISKAIRRINVGGKLLTNILKEVISYRQWNMMDEYYNVNDAKESLCYASTQFEKEMKYARDEETRAGCRIFDREFVLPDYVNSFQGRVRVPLRLQILIDEEEKKKKEVELKASPLQREVMVKGAVDADNDGDIVDDENSVGKLNSNSKKVTNGDEIDNDCDSEDESEEQIRKRIMKQREEEQRRREIEEEERQALLLSVERFTIPEILFRPSDIEMKQLGLAEAIVQSIEACDPIYHAAMYHNIVLTGGNMNIQNLKQRLETELRSIAPIQYKIRIHLPKDPVTFAFEGAQDIIQNEGFIGGMDRAEWEVNKQSGKVGKIWNSKRIDNLPDGFTLI